MKNGFTIIESILAMTIAGILSTTMIQYQVEKKKEINQKIFANDIHSIIKGIDQRISVDGYEYDLWTKKTWNNTTLNKLIKEDLQAINSSCGKGKWTPKNGDNKLKLVNCDLMDKLIYKLNIDIKIEKDSTGFINRTIIDYNFKDKKTFDKTFKEMRNSFQQAKTMMHEFKTGTAFYQYTNKETNKEIPIIECIKENINCIFRTTLDRQGGGEYLKVDGSNSMIGSKIKFINTKGQSPIKCINWKKNNIGYWTSTIDEDCGIGFYDNTPVTVSTNTVNGIFKNIQLNKLCNVYMWDGNNVTNTGKKEPCGMTDNGTTITQLIQNIQSDNGSFRDVYGSNGFLNYIKVNDLFSNSINVDYLNVINKTTFKGESVEFNNEKTTINGKKFNINATETIFEKGFYSKGIIKGDNLSITGRTDLIDTTTTKLTVNDSIFLNGRAIEDEKCNYNGEIKRDKTGSILNCINGEWKSGASSVPIGTVVMWTAIKIPKGWLEMNGQSTTDYPKLREIVGFNVPDLRGSFIRGWDNGKGLDRNRRLKSYQSDADQKITGEFVSIDRGYGWRDNNKIIKTVSRWNTNIRSGKGDQWGTIVSLDNSRTSRTALESRPKNIALMYIIKAK